MKNSVKMSGNTTEFLTGYFSGRNLQYCHCSWRQDRIYVTVTYSQTIQLKILKWYRYC